MNTHFSHFLFDLDGTLTDSREGLINSLLYAFKHSGRQIDNIADLQRYLGPPLKDSFMNFEGMNEEEALSAIVKFREYFTSKGIFENSVYPGILDLLEDLQQTSCSAIVATSKPQVFAEKIIHHFQLDSFFHGIEGSELDGRRIHKADVIAYTIEKHKLAKGEVVMIGDRKEDILGAHKNGIPCIGTLYGYGNRRELEDAKADCIVENIEELHHLVKKLSK